MTVWQPERGAEVAIRELLVSDWNYTGDGNFNDAWIHTGQYDEKNENAQITVTPGGETPRGDRGWNSINPSGLGPTTHVDGFVSVDVWVPQDTRDPSTGNYELTGVNPKKLVEDLRKESERIIDDNWRGTTYNGDPEFKFLSSGGYTPIPPQDSDSRHHHSFPALYTWYKGRYEEA